MINPLMLWPEKAKKYLDKYWKIEALKDKQFEVINSLLSGNDTIGLLPTGYGKSMCYLIPPLVTRKIIFIISPLISLMDDQKDKLTQMGIPCSALHSNNKNKDEEISLIIDKKIKIVYMSPEYLIKSDGMDLAELLIQNGTMGFLAVDESHCTSAWGHDFRPEYTKIKMFRDKFPHIPILAVTATATKNVCADISTMLGMNEPNVVIASFDRPNLFLQVVDIPKIGKKLIKKDKLVIPYIKKYNNEKIIVYINSRKDTETLANDINKTMGDNIACAYHAGLSKNNREEVQSKFSSGMIKIIIATIAFGMGIDQTVRCVLVIGAPSSIEEYYQQIGRGGRDGLQCETVLYFDYSKIIIGEYMLKKECNDPNLYRVKSGHLKRVKNFAYTNICRRKYILDYFGEKYMANNCNNCDNCCRITNMKPPSPKKETFEDKIDKYSAFLV